jgi:hypothetical protein
MHLTRGDLHTLARVQKSAEAVVVKTPFERKDERRAKEPRDRLTDRPQQTLHGYPSNQEHHSWAKSHGRSWITLKRGRRGIALGNDERKEVNESAE